MDDVSAPRPAPGLSAAEPALAVVMITRDRREATLATVRRLLDLPERPSVVVVDNGSSDGTSASLVALDHPRLVVRRLRHNGGAAGRTLGVRLASAELVAFSDDDSWWAPGALARAAAVLTEHPRVGLVAARVLIGPDERLDPTCAEMAASPLPRDGLPGPRVLGFVGCGAVVRTDAFLESGGYDDDRMIGGEEQPLALRMAAAGWDLTYVDEVVAHHHPSPARDVAARRRRIARNDLLTAWRHRRAAGAAEATRRALRSATSDRAARGGLADALLAAPRTLVQRSPVPPTVEAWAQSLDAG